MKLPLFIFLVLVSLSSCSKKTEKDYDYEDFKTVEDCENIVDPDEDLIGDKEYRVRIKTYRRVLFL